MKKLLMLLTLAAFALCGCSKYDYSSDHAFKESFVAQAKKEGLSEYQAAIIYKDIWQKHESVNVDGRTIYRVYTEEERLKHAKSILGNKSLKQIGTERGTLALAAESQKVFSRMFGVEEQAEQKPQEEPSFISKLWEGFWSIFDLDYKYSDDCEFVSEVESENKNKLFARWLFTGLFIVFVGGAIIIGRKIRAKRIRDKK
ncbi:MAG: hypothetical protein J6P03_04965 [Opitutales bacterium]|nr:hypothetical protein [Opitutales bacterium]